MRPQAIFIPVSQLDAAGLVAGLVGDIVKVLLEAVTIVEAGKQDGGIHGLDQGEAGGELPEPVAGGELLGVTRLPDSEVLISMP
ncbi:hypothetical protein [Aeromonas caviae]|uniref:hypothetical protein n=1 Tax=Aeromonas caviae TaxID=648 RepID=UPI001F2CD8A4|nr:hypothetical protein [Aeromonas caviae]